MRTYLGYTITLQLSALLLVSSVSAQHVLTQHNDNARTGSYLQETRLHTTNVTPATFGLLFKRQVAGAIYAQPLYMSGLDIQGKGKRNVVFVATMQNNVYAFDADNPEENQPLWGPLSLAPAVQLNDRCIGYNQYYQDVIGTIGVVSTPVISVEHHALYAVAFSQTAGHDSSGRATRTYTYTLYQISLTTGTIMKSTQMTQAVTDVMDIDCKLLSETGPTDFQTNRQDQRPGLLLANNTVYVAFASYGDQTPYHGWVFGYDANTLEPVGSPYNTTPISTGSRGGIWMSGQGIAADADNNLYFMTGNGTVTTPDTTSSQHQPIDLGLSFIKLSPQLNLTDWFTPCNYQCLNSIDFDLASAGLVLLPETNFLLGGGKQGQLYVLDQNKMGHYSPTNDQIVQSFCAGGNCGQCGTSQPSYPCGNPPQPDTSNTCGQPSQPSGDYISGEIHGAPVYWDGPDGPYIYVWPQGKNCVKAYKFMKKDGKFQTTPVSQGNCGSTPCTQFPGGILALSANGQTAGTGILWALTATENANQQVVPGVLHAYDALDLSKELWNSQMHATRDKLGNFSKFPPPTVVNGKVYVATLGNPMDKPYGQPDAAPVNQAELLVYGLLP